MKIGNNYVYKQQETKIISLSFSRYASEIIFAILNKGQGKTLEYFNLINCTYPQYTEYSWAARRKEGHAKVYYRNNHK
jgi:hypothetical protein